MGQYYINLIGQKYGLLTVVEDLGSKDKKRWWRCKCECGGEKITHTAALRHGSTKSCGCLRYKTGIYKYNQEQSEQSKIPNGTRFGKLVVIEDIGFIPHVEGHQRRGYKCLCDCGNECITSGNQLKSGQKKTCGHCETSIGEYNIIQLLKQYNINFKHDSPLEDLTNKYGRKLRFDFILYDKNNNIMRIIEFDGRQHVTGPDTNYWGHMTDSLETIIEKDNIKNEYCLKNNIPLIRIPYWKRDKITIEDLLEDNYRV